MAVALARPVGAAETTSRAKADTLPDPGPPAKPSTSRAHRLVWDEQWTRFRTLEYVTTAATGAAAIVVFYFAKPSNHPLWVGPVLFDEPVRNLLRLRTRTGILTAEAASGAIAIALPVQSLLDSLLPPVVDGSYDVMWQLGMMDAQSYALSGLLTASLYDTTGRARPSYAACKAGTSIDPYCDSGEFASFPSGHTAVSMTGAGLMCAHHGELPLYGVPALDVAACVEGLALATSVGVLRLMADRHYAPDVLTGGAIGFFSGYALPRLLHYWRRPLGEIIHRPALNAAIVLGSERAPVGVRLVGVF